MQNTYDRAARLLAAVGIVLGVFAAMSHVSGARAVSYLPPSQCSDSRCGVDMFQNSPTNKCPVCNNGNPLAVPPVPSSEGKDCGWVKTLPPNLTCDFCVEGSTTCKCHKTQDSPPKWVCQK